MLSNICMVVPAGLVCFFPSYEYKEKVVKEWCQSGAFQKIDAKKKVRKFQVQDILCLPNCYFIFTSHGNFVMMLFWGVIRVLYIYHE